MKNIPTNLYTDNGDKFVIRTWESGGGEMPRKAQKAIKEFDILIDNQKFTVYYNRSTRAEVNYYYLKFNDLWHWTRDNISLKTQYTTSR